MSFFIQDFASLAIVSIHIGACFDPHVELFLPLEKDAGRCEICFEDFGERISQLTENPSQWYFAAVVQDQTRSTPVCDAISLNTWLLTNNDF